MKKFPLFGALVGVLVLGVASYFFVYAFFVYAPNTISEQEGVWVEIPELNIKLWMPADKSDLVYSAVVSDGAFGSVVLLSSASLMEAQKMAESGEYLEYCTPAHSPLGRILPFTAGTI